MQTATQNYEICEENIYDNVFLEPGYIPSRSEEYMSTKQLAFFRRKLLEWRVALQNEAAETVEHLKQEALDEPDLSDRATAETEINLELSNRSRLRKLINQIDSALERINNRSYGYCEETGEEIGVARLIARPIAKMCIEAQEEHEKFEKLHNKIIKLHERDDLEESN